MIREWISVITKKPVTLQEFERSKVCAKCDDKYFSKFLDIIDGEFKDVQGYGCKKCGCPLVAKLKTTNKKHICDKWEN